MTQHDVPKDSVFQRTDQEPFDTGDVARVAARGLAALYEPQDTTGSMPQTTNLPDIASGFRAKQAARPRHPSQDA